MMRVCALPRCSVEFKPRRASHIFCSRRCKNLAQPKRARPRQPATCPACDIEFIPRDGNGRKRVSTQVYCGNQCAASPRRMRSTGNSRMVRSTVRWSLGEARYVPSRPPERTCAQCGGTYRPKRQEDRGKFCSRKCKDDARFAPPEPRPCLACGVAFTPPRNRNAAFCSRGCNQRARRLALDGPRRAIKTGVAERDGWRCQICLEPVDRSVRWPDPLSASVDHIVLVALGGSNDQDNLRLTHLGCNMRRGGWTR